ncbi:polysaccharide biosynthesis tyrosine autokinase [Prevotella buccae]|uniref:GumC family protein n=2 Tax=Segatella buccae TaxID=28126 RepID=UPI001C5E3207|nr:polysaccharide biosynthesis tyrosine autokinase [Segatella buccae]MBW4871878.1 polysaccharide biosynthesis tyrosine autokinase [Segatella buccae]
MEVNKNIVPDSVQEQEEKSSFDFQAIYTTLILNWKWFVLSLIICIGAAFIYLRYTPPVYQAYAKMLIKDDEGNNRRGNGIQNMANLGMITNSNGIDNEMEILSSHTMATDAVRDLKLYTTYKSRGRVTDRLLYLNQPVSIDLDPSHLEKLEGVISLQIEHAKNGFHVTGNYIDKNGDEYVIDKNLSNLPSTIGTKVGILSFTRNRSIAMPTGFVELVTIMSPNNAAYKFQNALTVSQTSKTTTIAQLVLKDQIPERAEDYLKQLAIVYNRQANEDKNEIAVRTEEFINGRLEKINAELGTTEGALEAYKKRNSMVELKMNAGQAVQNADEYSQKLAEANTQVALLNSISEYMNEPSNKYQTLPSNVGLTDQSATSLINRYNEIVLERNRLLRSASENSPTVTPLTSQLDDLSSSIKRAMGQARNSMSIQRNAVAAQYGKYQGQVGATPEQERILTQIGRQQDVKSGLYLMLLQKREENSISLAATADKGKLIDMPETAGKVSPKGSMILLIALILGLGIPALIIFILQFFHYRIEGHNDVVRLTKLPIIADVAIASETAKTKADIVVHENKNNMMEEIFRSMRTNLQFMLKEGEKVILFTSSTSGEGKTFNAANLSVSFALLGKKVILVGLDIRKPRLAELFEIDDHQHGITNLLIHDTPTWAQVQQQILPSGINNNLELLMAGPTPPNPAELVNRQSLDTIVKMLREHYDYIIIDTAPVGLVTDTLQIGRIADATIYTCRADYTPKESFGLINSLAAENKLPNMSIIINGIDMSKKKYGYYYGYGRYGKYGRYGRYGSYSSYGSYGSYGTYGTYGNYTNSHYGDKNDDSIKR